MRRNESTPERISIRGAVGRLIAATSVLVSLVLTGSASAEVTVLRAARLLVGNGETIERAVVVIADGRIVAVGPDVPLPEGATVIDVPEGVITPGLIDANALIEPSSLFELTRDGRSAPTEVLAPPTDEIPMSFAAGLDPTAPPHAGSRRGRGRFLAQIVMHQHALENCSVCDLFAASDACAFAAAHEDLAAQGEDVVCAVCGYPGTLIDHLQVASGVQPGLVLSESSSEVVAHTHIIDSMNLRSPDLERLLRGGVTTVFAAPDTTAVIGPRGAIIRTGGPVRDRVIEPAAAVTASISTDPFRGAVRNSTPRRGVVTFNARRPNTRMGLAWVFRKAFHDAQAVSAGRPIGGADTPPVEAIPVLQAILDGTVPLRIHARQQNDIEAAIRLGAEFDLSFALIEATEAFKTIEAIRTAGVPVIFGPIWIEPSGPRARMADSRDSRLSTIVELVRAGVPTALSAQDLRDHEGLAGQMMFAVRAGLAPDDAIRATTETPARLLGLDERIGTVEAGKDADLVIWNGAPHESGAEPVLVMIAGRIVHRK